MGLAGKSSIYFLLSKTHCAVWAEVALSMQVKKSYQTAVSCLVTIIGIHMCLLVRACVRPTRDCSTDVCIAWVFPGLGPIT